MDVGIIGVGTMGRNHVRVYSELKSVDSVGVYDVNAGGQAIGRQHGAEVYGSIDELLAHSDAVSVCVPRSSMRRCPQVFAAKKSVLIEKPICATAQEAEHTHAGGPSRDHDRCRAHRTVQPDRGEIKKIVRKPVYVEMKRHNPASARVTGSTVVEDLMIHDIDILLNLFGMPSDIHSAGNADVCSVLMKCGKIPLPSPRAGSPPRRSG